MTGQRSTVNGQQLAGNTAVGASHASPLPPRPFLVALVNRGIIIWASMRLIVAMGIAMLDAGPMFRLPASAAFPLALVAGTLGWLELRRRREHLLLGSLGISQPVLFLVALLPAVVAESLLLLAEHVPA